MIPRCAARIRQAAQACRRPGTAARTSAIHWLLLLGAALSPAGHAADHPRAHEDATVVAGQARFTVLTARLIRLEFSEDGRFEDRASLTFVNRLLPVPEYSVSRTGGWLRIATDALTRSRRCGSMTFRWTY